MNNKISYTLLLCFCVFAKVMQAQEIPLDKGWQFSRTDDTTWRTATVPGTIHTDLIAHQLIPDPFVGSNEKAVQWVDKKDWIYRTDFNVTAAFLEQQVVELDLRGLDTYADVYVNEHLVLQSHNMFITQKVNVKQWLTAGNNRLRILFHSPIKQDMPAFLRDSIIYPAGNDASDIPLSIYARKAPYHYGWDWGPRLVTSGIWRPVFLRAWNKTDIQDAWLQQQSLTDKAATILAAVTLQTVQAGRYTIRIESKEKAFATVTTTTSITTGPQVVNLPFTISKPQRWWPNGLGVSHLYNVQVTVLDGNQVLSTRALHIGLRTVEVVNAPDSMGVSFYVKVNGRPVFMKGADYIPQDNFLPRVTSGKYRKLFADMKESNFNMVRVWGGGIYEDDQFYDLADENGILVWQDFMFACTVYPSDSAFLENVKTEVAYNITRLRNHPSLALWCGNNEVAMALKHWGWKDGYGYTEKQWQSLQKGYDVLFKELLPRGVQTLDPGRFYFHSSPISNWGLPEDFRTGDNHYWGVWHGMEWFDAFNTHIPRFMSEYGFQSFPDIHTVRRFTSPNERDLYSPVMLSHQKNAARGNTAINTYLLHYYKQPKDFESFLYVNQVLQAEGIKVAIEAHRRNMPFCMGTLYWQLNDCWPGPSWSGRDYYGRWKALQYYVKKAFEPLLVSNIITDGHLRTYIISDEPRDEQVTLDMQLMDVEGKVLWHKTLPGITARFGKSIVQHEINVSDLLKGADTGKVIFYTKVVKENKLLSDNVFYFVNANTMNLPDPGIRTEITADKEGTIQVKIAAGKLARNVYLLVDNDPESHFSNNYFDLLPGEETTVILNTTLTLQQVKDQLKVISLIDTFKN
ncbi:beta-mannosidase [Chitinophaga sp. CF118]|uniref:beta-mannosidase n=1 Tax=Chitinophaga sp. CF118 TaxID=1884367 RepID=UPI0008E5AAA4|nr:glycoside hydrolase family 2 protein [Chitinophaga sp. CF118]SFD14312.1 beta-mannosidase [Chitinophaga sp. CF118]